MSKISIVPWLNGDQKGYDIKIVDPTATVEDYHITLSQFILEEVKERYRAETNDCEGCNICCQERIPLTYIDVKNLKKQIVPDSKINDFLKKYGYIVVEGNMVDISLARDFDGKCIFLRKDDHRCSIYNERPLVCRTYICLPASSRAKNLRSEIVNSGMDVLINHWLMDENIYIHEEYDSELNQENWEKYNWPSDEYGCLLIKDVISEKLFQKLIK